MVLGMNKHERDTSLRDLMAIIKWKGGTVEPEALLWAMRMHDNLYTPREVSLAIMTGFERGLIEVDDELRLALHK